MHTFTDFLYMAAFIVLGVGGAGALIIYVAYSLFEGSARRFLARLCPRWRLSISITIIVVLLILFLAAVPYLGQSFDSHSTH